MRQTAKKCILQRRASNANLPSRDSQSANRTNHEVGPSHRHILERRISARHSPLAGILSYPMGQCHRGDRSKAHKSSGGGMSPVAANIYRWASHHRQENWGRPFLMSSSDDYISRTCQSLSVLRGSSRKMQDHKGFFDLRGHLLLLPGQLAKNDNRFPYRKKRLSQSEILRAYTAKDLTNSKVLRSQYLLPPSGRRDIGDGYSPLGENLMPSGFKATGLAWSHHLRTACWRAQGGLQIAIGAPFGASVRRTAWR